MCPSRLIQLAMLISLLSGCESTTKLQTQASTPVPPDASLMIPPPQELAEIEAVVVERNDLRLALPTISNNYKTYHLIRERLIGLQQYVNILMNKEKDDVE